MMDKDINKKNNHIGGGEISPIVSVIIPTYNPNKELLVDAIESVYAQTFKDYEVIVVDDCSNQRSQLLLEELKTQYDFTLIRLDENSGGPSKPLNIGISHAQGKYIAPCPHDDIWLKSKLARQVEFMERVCEYALVYSRAYIRNKKKWKRDKEHYKSGLIFNDLFLQKFSIPALTVLIRKEIFNDVGFFDESLLLDDFDMWLRISHKHKIGYIDEHLAVYIVHGKNQHLTKTHSIIQDAYKINRKWENEEVYPLLVKLVRFYDFRATASLFEYFMITLRCFVLSFNKNVGVGFFMKRVIKLWFFFLRKKIRNILRKDVLK